MARHSSLSPRHPTGCDRPVVQVEDEQVTLSFDARAVQSAMDPQRPNHLVLHYTRFMMGFLLFHPQPRDILIVGLGGGSLPKYCYHHLPDCRVTSVEINAKVIALRGTFALPADDDRFTVVHGDAADYLTESVAEFDAILLDGFDAGGIPKPLSSSHFYRRCRRALREEGVLAANFSTAGWAVATCVNRLYRAFDGQVVHARPNQSGFQCRALCADERCAPGSGHTKRAQPISGGFA